MANERSIEQTVAKLILLAEAQGMTIEDLLEMLESGASVADVALALCPRRNRCA
jgi:hypothetical protein